MRLFSVLLAGAVLPLAACTETVEVASTPEAQAEVVASTDPAPVEVTSAEEEDPYLWLEEIEGEAALAQVEEWNRETEDKLMGVAGVAERAERARAILNSPDRLEINSDEAEDFVIGTRVLNHWTDENSKRGLWRIADLDEYLAGSPDWRTLIDVDALGEAEDESWVWHGAECLAPDYKRCLIALSPGGTDADVVREFDLETGSWVKGGFALPLGKNEVSWVDADTLLVSPDEGGDSLTESGYPRTARLWTRGTHWSEAVQVMEVPQDRVWLFPTSFDDGDTRYTFLRTGPDFFTEEWHLLVDSKPIKMPMPSSLEVLDIFAGQLITKLIEPLDELQAGDIVSWDMEAMASGGTPSPQLVMRPSASQSLENVTTTDHFLFVSALDDVSGKLFAIAREGEGWTTARELPMAANSTIEMVGASGRRDTVFVKVDSMLAPTALVAMEADGSSRVVQQLPELFDADGMSVTQHFATSKDGTKVPYFLVKRDDVTEPTGTLIHAYGGFRAAQLPSYLVEQPYRSGPLGLFWVEDGGAFVLANIRGGSEYGPKWHANALREKRQNSFDDLAAVAEDLIARGVARPDGVAISGRSNGGVLTGAGITQRPDLYAAAIIGSPLFDMKRYHKLLAGASWVSEYGDPDKPEDWTFMSKYSPYQNIQPGTDYPATFWYLSTKDDRVHPGHARKGAARLEAYGNAVYYRENTEGGHSVGSDNEADALRAALEWAFLMKEVGTSKAPE